MFRIKFTTAGESHGEMLMGIIEGVPSNLSIDISYIEAHLKRRMTGYGRGARMKIESDTPYICSGIRFGKTLGSPIGIIIKNNDWENWKEKMSVEKTDVQINEITIPRPGHADLAGIKKYNFRDIRNVIERSSARETAMRVALATICRKLLEECNIHIGSYVSMIHNVKDENNYFDKDPRDINKLADQSSVRSLDENIESKMIDVISNAKSKGDSVGGSFTIIISGLPYGLGSYVSWDKKLNARLGKAILSINGIKSFDIGLGEDSGKKYGSELHDEIGYDEKFTRLSNNCGGIEGGMSNGQSIILSATMKPIPTLTKPLNSIDIKSKSKVLAHKERTDSCSVPAASIIAESMASFVICDTLLEKFGGDSIEDLLAHLKVSAKY
jgi:chorismate synthase